MEEENPEENNRIPLSLNIRKRLAPDEVSKNTIPEKVAKTTEKSDVHSVYCSICQKNVTTETIGKPDCCDHEFCLVCILEWSKKKNTCPVDRERFRKIYFTNPAHNTYEGHCTVADIPDIEEQDIVEEIDPLAGFCRVCAMDLDDLVGHCSTCNRRVHLACMDPNSIDETGYRCQECIVFCGFIDVMLEAAGIGTQEGAQNAVGEEDVNWNARMDELDPELREDIAAYTDAARIYVRTADRRLRFHRQLELLGERLNIVGNLIELLEDLSTTEDCHNSLTDFTDRIQAQDNLILTSLEAADEYLSEHEGNDELLDEYITIAQNALKDAEEDEAQVREAECSCNGYIAEFVKDLEKRLDHTGEDDDE